MLVRQASAVVGSAKGCTIRLREKECPLPQACRLEKKPDGVVAVALSADCPLLLNGVGLEGEGVLKHGDVLSVGGVELQYQDIIPPGGPRLKPGGGILGPITGLAILLIIGAELALLGVTTNWPKYLIEENIEKIDIAYAAKQRQLRGEKDPEENKEQKEKKVDASSIIVMPGTSLGETKTDAPETAAVPAPVPPADAEGGGDEAGAGKTAPPSDGTAGAGTTALADLTEELREALDGADFERAEIGDIMEGVPKATGYEPIQDSLETLLTEAKTAAQFSDYPRAFQLLNQLHQTAPGYLPAHMYHAQLLEARGELDEAYRRWKQLMGLAGEDDEMRAQIVQAGRRLQQRIRLRKNIGGYAGVDPAKLPGGMRIESPTMQKMPADSEIAEMRILRGKIVPGTGVAPDAELLLFITFYDQVPGGSPVPTRALVSPSPMNLAAAGANASGAPTFEATYIVPAVPHADGGRGTASGTSYSSIYYGYTLHLFADGVLQDACAKPARLLSLPIHVPKPSDR